MADQEYLASFGVEIDEGGVSRLHSVLAENRELAEGLASAFDRAEASLQALREAFREALSSGAGFGEYGAGEEGAFGSGGLRLGLDLSGADKGLGDFIAKAKQPVPLSANASGILSAGRSALGSLRSLFSSPVTVRFQAEVNGGGGRGGGDGSTDLRMSSGGRFSKPTSVEVAEDGGTEYVIPVRREGRAVPLLRQLLSELSPSARESLSLPSGGMASLGGGVAAGAPGQVTQNNHKNVSAPVTINVKASGTDPEAVGRGIYDAAERYLLRTLRG